jgi:AraC-like DNA-binding protein
VIWPSDDHGRITRVDAQASIFRFDGAIVLHGRGRDYAAATTAGPLSVKCVLGGAAVWRTGGREFILRSNAYVVLNDGEPYSIEIDSPAAPATTFCVFFARGWVEDIARALSEPPARLLDDPGRVAPLEFTQHMAPFDPDMRRAIARLRRTVEMRLDEPDALIAVAETLLRQHQATMAQVQRIGAVKASTRAEVYRRLLRGRDYLISHQDRRVPLAEAARAACLSPYHFHRAFVAAFRVAPHAFIVEQRLLRAAALLGADDRSVGDVCVETGFVSIGSFSNAFRRRFGIPPGSYRSIQNRKIG